MKKSDFDFAAEDALDEVSLEVSLPKATMSPKSPGSSSPG